MHIILTLPGQQAAIELEAKAIEIVSDEVARLIGRQPEHYETDGCEKVYDRMLPGGVSIIAPVAGGLAGGYYRGVPASALSEGMAVQLEVEPDNPYDPYAVAVYALPGVLGKDRYQLGYLPAGLAVPVCATLAAQTIGAPSVEASIARVRSNGRSLAGVDLYFATVMEEW